MWRLWNWLFGWQYVYIDNLMNMCREADETYISRVFKGPDNARMVTIRRKQILLLGSPYIGWSIIPLTEGIAHYIKHNDG